MADEGRAIVLNYNALLGTLKTSVSRSVVMMGSGLSASEARPHLSHILAHEGRFGITLVPEEVNEQTRDHFAEEFGKWVRANGLRELLESFSIYLMRLYDILFVLRTHVNGQADPALMMPDRFEKRGISDQMTEVAKLIPVEQRAKDVLASLNQARNCYAHRQGRVGQPDLINGQFTVTWDRLSVSIEQPDGTIIPEEDMFDVMLKEGGLLRIGFVVQDRTFGPGEELTLEKFELLQIFLYVFQLGERLFKDAFQAAVDAGLAEHPAPAPEAQG